MSSPRRVIILARSAGAKRRRTHLIDPGGVAVNSTGAAYLADFDPIRSGPAEGTGVVDVFGPEVEQRSLSVSVMGGASMGLGDGQNSSVAQLAGRHRRNVGM